MRIVEFRSVDGFLTGEGRIEHDESYRYDCGVFGWTVMHTAELTHICGVPLQQPSTTHGSLGFACACGHRNVSEYGYQQASWGLDVDGIITGAVAAERKATLLAYRQFQNYWEHDVPKFFGFGQGQTLHAFLYAYLLRDRWTRNVMEWAKRTYSTPWPGAPILMAAHDVRQQIDIFKTLLEDAPLGWGPP